MSWVTNITGTDESNEFTMNMNLNNINGAKYSGLSFSFKVSITDLQNFIKYKELMIENKKHGMHLHIIKEKSSRMIHDIQYVLTDETSSGNDFKIRFDGSGGQEIYKYVYEFVNKYLEEKAKSESELES
jgi:hypothetical protein